MKKIAVCLCLVFVFFLFCTAGAPPESVSLPVLMYHSVTVGKSQYILSPSRLEEDFSMLTQDGFSFVSVQELYDYTDGKGSLPEKPLLLTFDDGHYNNLSHALPLLEKYDGCAVVSVVGKYSDYATRSGESHQPNYSYLTWDDVAELDKSGRISVGNHTYALHEFSPRFGIGRIKGEPDAAYLNAISADIQKLNNKLSAVCAQPCTVFAYPFGRYNSLAEKQLVSMGFRMTLTCNPGINTVRKGHPEDLLRLKRIHRSSEYSSERILALCNGNA